MAKRLITAAIGVPLGVLILCIGAITPHIIAIATDLLGVIAVFEILSAAKYTKYKSITIISLAFSALLPLFFCYSDLREYAVPVAFLFLTVVSGAAILRHKEIKFDELGLIAFISICLPFSISTLAFFRFAYERDGIFLIVYTLIVAWIADGGAYFAGTFFGKHKLCPEISPKKTWEGFIGGLIASVVFALLTGWCYELIDRLAAGESRFTVNMPLLAAAAFVSAFLGLLGDLIASLLKRQCGIKDFGNILPGHGGVMDRFDSVLYVAPFIYLLFKFIPPVINIG